MPRHRRVVVLAVAAALFLAACGGSNAAGRATTAPASPAAMAATAGDPVDIATLPAHIAARYRFIEQHQPLARRMPCYCGCGSLGHRDLADCFIGRQGGYEGHAVDCGVCIAQAQDVETMLAQGMTARAIRERIDTVYAPMGPGTNTPKP